MTTFAAVFLTDLVARVVNSPAGTSFWSTQTIVPAAAAVLGTAMAVAAWTLPVVTFSAKGAKIPSRKVIPWSEIDSLDLGSSGLRARSARVLLRNGDEVALVGADRAALSGVKSILPDGVRLQTP